MPRSDVDNLTPPFGLDFAAARLDETVISEMTMSARGKGVRLIIARSH